MSSNLTSETTEFEALRPRNVDGDRRLRSGSYHCKVGARHRALKMGGPGTTRGAMVGGMQAATAGLPGLIIPVQKITCVPHVSTANRLAAQKAGQIFG